MELPRIAYPLVSDQPSASVSVFRSMMWEPVVRHGETVGVLVVSWQSRVAGLSDRKAAAVSLRADAAAAALDTRGS